MSLLYDTNNVFAKILRKELSCQIVAQTDHSLAFNDIHPQAPVHILVIPKGAYVTMSDFVERASREEMGDFFGLLETVMREKNLWHGAARIVVNQGAEGGQEVPHFHMHLLGGWTTPK